ncbi:hypothetical protein Megvenef_01380 [Candidatus Megaera venefica]|uniref:DnaA N-terminal domain-containing protein n=1 Tax=Candidatus Megaera venefica TaxID=2055910 RepID=A0ABU5NDZ4_9RICK|nr:hypothetical protein [Candidatus Megaera venefica]MEA0971402.1 hypothetical protein [Candidatus Megaera venefica]
MKVQSNTQLRKANVSGKKKSNILYISSYKKRNVVKAYTKTDDDWYEILRANDTCSKVSFKAARLVGKLILELHKNNDRSVYKDNYWFSKIVNVSSAKQNLRIRKQISHIFNFPFRKTIIVDGTWLKDVYEISFTENAYKILNFEDAKIDKKDGEVNALDTASNKSLHGDTNVSTYGHKCPSYMYDKEKEEEALAYSSSFSNNEKLKIKNFTKPKPALQEASTGIPTLATGFMNEPAKVYQTEEIRTEATEVVTNCDSLAELRALQDIPILANFLTKTENIPSEEGSVNTGQTNQITQLKAEIFKAFDSKTSEEIMENCTFTELEPNKLGISIKAKFIFSEHDKQKLKTCVHMTYGSEIKMVNTSAVKQQAAPMQAVAEPTQIRSNCHRWDRFKNELLKYFPEKTGDHILNAWFDKLRVSEDAPNNRIILSGSTFYVDSVYNRFQSAIESVVKKQKVTLELHYENNSQRPMIYKPN